MSKKVANATEAIQRQMVLERIQRKVLDLPTDTDEQSKSRRALLASLTTEANALERTYPDAPSTLQATGSPSTGKIAAYTAEVLAEIAAEEANGGASEAKEEAKGAKS